MLSTIRQILAPLKDKLNQRAHDALWSYLADRLNSVTLNSAGLVIKAGASALVKCGNAFYASADGKTVTKAANTDMAALSGTTNNATFNFYDYFVDSAGTLSTVMGTAGATLAAAKHAEKPTGAAWIGFTIINPTGTGNFVGGTTAIDDATVVPNAVHVSLVGVSDPTFFLK